MVVQFGNPFAGLAYPISVALLTVVIGSIFSKRAGNRKWSEYQRHGTSHSISFKGLLN